MLIFSTMLEIKNSVTKDDFIRLVLEWNQNSPHKENVIPNIEWTGEKNIKYGTDVLWLGIQEYRDKNIVAIRFEKHEDSGRIWDSDYVLNFDEMKLSIQLYRSFEEDAINLDPEFSTPHIISMLIDKGFLEDDNDLPVQSKPIYITQENANIIASITNGTVMHRLPVIYVSKTVDNKNPVDVYQLARQVKGVAHVFIENDIRKEYVVRKLCNDENVTNGEVAIYYPNGTLGCKKYSYRPLFGNNYLLENLKNSVIQYANSQNVIPLYTWYGVNNAILFVRVESKKNEVNDVYSVFGEDITKLKNQVDQLMNANNALSEEIKGLRKKYDSMDKVPILYLGKEEELYSGEISEMLLDAVSRILPQTGEGTRRFDVYTDILNNNEYNGVIEKRKKTIKALLKDYTTMSSTLNQKLQDMGFTITDEGKHYKLVFCGDNRYKCMLSKTGSDWREGKNAAAEINGNMM